jgi:hypothetical protein
MRVTIAFQCTVCAWYNYPQLRENMSGNFTILCGNCGHAHHRAIQSGKVTEDRHYAAYGAVEVIHVMKSACSPEPRRLSKIARLRDYLFAGAGH